MRDTAPRSPWLYLPALVLFSGYAWFVTRRYWSDSEIWALRQGTVCLESWSLYACSWKPLFNLCLSFLSQLADVQNVVSMMELARLALLVSWLILLLQAWRFAYSPMLLLAYFGTSLFILDSSVARSDFFALPFLFWHLGLLCEKTKLEHRVLLKLALTAAVAILITPKALVTLFCFLPFYGRLLPTLSLAKLSTRTRALGFASGFLLITILVLAVDWRGVSGFFLHLFREDEYGSPYFSSERLSFLARACRENFQLFYFVVAYLLLSLFRLYREKFKSFPARDMVAFLLLLSVALFPDRLPFWISAQAFLFLFAAGPVFLKKSAHRLVALWVAVFSIANGAHWLRLMPDYLNTKQIALSQPLQREVDQRSGLRVYDGLGLIKSAQLPSLFLGPGQSDTNLMHLKMLETANFDLIVITHKVTGFQFVIAKYLADNYTNPAPDLYLRKEKSLSDWRLRPLGRFSTEFAFEPLDVERPTILD